MAVINGNMGETNMKFTQEHVGKKVIVTGLKGLSRDIVKIGDIAEILKVSDSGIEIKAENWSHSQGVHKNWDIVELLEEYPISPFFGKKYRVTPESSELLQLEVFKAGGNWYHGATFVKYLEDGDFGIQVNEKGEMLRLTDEEDFIYSDLPEATLEVVKSIQIKEIIPAKSEKQLQKEEILRKIDELKAEFDKLEV